MCRGVAGCSALEGQGTDNDYEYQQYYQKIALWEG